MGRKKTIDDAALLQLIKEYYDSLCARGIRKIKLPQLVEYIVAKGYLGYRVESLRRNEKARAYIDSLNQLTEKDAHRIVAVYKTLDVDNLLECNRTTASLKTALVTLDAHYRQVAESAVEIDKKYWEMKQQYEEAYSALAQAKEENAELAQAVLQAKRKVAELEAEKDRLKEIVNDYVYPDIANTLLAMEGDLLNAETIIDPEKLDACLIKGDVEIPHENKNHYGSAVIKNLFDSFEEE